MVIGQAFPLNYVLKNLFSYIKHGKKLSMEERDHSGTRTSGLGSMLLCVVFHIYEGRIVA